VGRIDPPDPLPDAVAMTARDGEPPPMTIAALGHCEPLVGPFVGWAAALALLGALSKRHHELLALRTAHNCHSEFEWTEHSRFARDAGVTEDELERVASGSHGTWDRNEQLLLIAADELHAHSSINSATWTELSEYFTMAELVEAIYVVGQYTMLSMVANVAVATD
jgi:alkylhydroperoxidase family enzyme